MMKSSILYEDWFSKEDCNYITSEAERLLDINPATTGELDSKVRKVRQGMSGFITTALQEHMPLWNFIAPRFWNAINDANRNSYDFNVNYLDSIQYTVYNGDEEAGDFYDWHIDTFIETPNAYQRKLSVTLQLSDTNDYEGGDFEFMHSSSPSNVRGQGNILVFPSFMTHRVTPVTKGTRRSLVAWFEGSKFK